MQIHLNDKTVELPEGASVSDALTAAGIAAAGTAVAIGDRVLPRAEWDTTQLTDGIRLTVIRAVCGG